MTLQRMLSAGSENYMNYEAQTSTSCLVLQTVLWFMSCGSEVGIHLNVALLPSHNAEVD